MYRWLTDLSQTFMGRDYLLEGQTVDNRVSIICNTAEKILGIPRFGLKLKDYIQKGWISLSTPIWTNFGTDRGLPISCFGSYIADNMESIAYTWAEICMMTKHGGGTSAYLGKIRPRGSGIKDNGQSSGSVHFAQIFDNLVNVISQGKTRRGNCAVYQDIDHPDIEEFLTIRNDGSPIQDLLFGVCIPDYWMRDMIKGNLRKREIWAKVLENRINIGLPYLLFTDNVNKNKPECYKDCPITASNLCSEIMEPTTEDESFVCDLSSVNDFYYDEWKDTDCVEVVTYLLDAVTTEFIEKARKIKFMERAAKFAERHRALGIGRLGWHSYLQSKMIPYESMEAKCINIEISRNIKEKAYKASTKLGQTYGYPEMCKDRRNTVLIALAPTKSSAFILGQMSEQCEPHRANFYTKDLAKGRFTIKNTQLEELLKKKDKNTDEVWTSILQNAGSVQHLDFLSVVEKEIFKTFTEISPKEVIIQAASRQKYIDQGQSLNLMIHPSIPVRDINKLMIESWEMGIKSLYYQFSINTAQNFSRNILSCKSCEG